MVSSNHFQTKQVLFCIYFNFKMISELVDGAQVNDGADELVSSIINIQFVQLVLLEYSDCKSKHSMGAGAKIVLLF